MRSIGYGSRREFLQVSAAIAAASALTNRRVAASAEQDLIVRSAEPYNAEPRLLALVADAVTPVNHFYVRNHGPTPKIDVAQYKLRMEGLVDKPIELTLDDIKRRFREVTVEATLT